jgi:hypothetical protein
MSKHSEKSLEMYFGSRDGETGVPTSSHEDIEKQDLDNSDEAVPQAKSSCSAGTNKDVIDIQGISQEEEDPDVVFWDGPDDPANPKNWPMWRKWVCQDDTDAYRSNANLFAVNLLFYNFLRHVALGVCGGDVNISVIPLLRPPARCDTNHPPRLSC